MYMQVHKHTHRVVSQSFTGPVGVNSVLSCPQRGVTALHCSSHAGQTAVVKQLLDKGAEVHAVTKVE